MHSQIYFRKHFEWIAIYYTHSKSHLSSEARSGAIMALMATIKRHLVKNMNGIDNLVACNYQAHNSMEARRQSIGENIISTPIGVVLDCKHLQY